MKEAQAAGATGMEYAGRLAVLRARDPEKRTPVEKEELDVVQKAAAAHLAVQKEIQARIDSLSARIDGLRKEMERLKSLRAGR